MKKLLLSYTKQLGIAVGMILLLAGCIHTAPDVPAPPGTPEHMYKLAPTDASPFKQDPPSKPIYMNPKSDYSSATAPGTAPRQLPPGWEQEE